MIRKTGMNRRTMLREMGAGVANWAAVPLPGRYGLTARWSHDYKRNGTTTLFEALEVATAYPRIQLHVVVDNYATHKHPTVKTELADNPCVTMHFAPTSGSCMNMVEIFFGIITRQAIRRGVFHS